MNDVPVCRLQSAGGLGEGRCPFTVFSCYKSQDDTPFRVSSWRRVSSELTERLAPPSVRYWINPLVPELFCGIWFIIQVGVQFLGTLSINGLTLHQPPTMTIFSVFQTQSRRLRRCICARYGKVRQESPVNARVMRNSAVIPRWPSDAILNFIEPEIAPFDPPTPKTPT